MDHSKLFVFVEGINDEDFLKKVIEPVISNSFEQVVYIRYKKTNPGDVANKLRGILKIPQANYIFLHDFDEHPCITKCKKTVLEEFSPALDQSKLFIVRQEIESWYLAGITKEICKKLKVKFHKDTQKVSKEKFNTLIPPSFIRTDFMVELLKMYSIEEAKIRNGSFRYFCDKYLSAN